MGSPLHHASEEEGEGGPQGQTQREEEGHDAACGFSFIGEYFFGPEAHAETGQVAVGEGEDDHEDDVPGVVFEEDWHVEARVDVAEHEEWNEDETQNNHQGQQLAVLPRPHAGCCEASASPVKDIEKQETGDRDEIQVPFAASCDCGLHISQDSWKYTDGNCEHQADTESQDPDLFKDSDDGWLFLLRPLLRLAHHGLHSILLPFLDHLHGGVHLCIHFIALHRVMLVKVHPWQNDVGDNGQDDDHTCHNEVSKGAVLQ